MFVLFIVFVARCLALPECQSKEPTLQILREIVCPTNHPAICLPYGACCRLSEFCHFGMCESCFPLDVPPEHRLEWCRHSNVSSMRHHTCRLACHDIFSDMLFDIRTKTSDENRVNSSTQTAPRDDNLCGHTPSVCWATATVTVALIYLVVAAGALTILYFRHKQRKRRRFSTKVLNKSLNYEVRTVISRVERITASLKEGGNGSYLVGGENVQSLHNQLTELSQVLKDWSQSRGSVCTLSAMAVLESNHISMVIPEDDKWLQQKKLNRNDFV